MFQTLRKILNIFTFFLLVTGAIFLGILGFFNVEALKVFMGAHGSRFAYCTIGLFGLYGIHLFMEYSKVLLESKSQNELSQHSIDHERSYED